MGAIECWFACVALFLNVPEPPQTMFHKHTRTCVTLAQAPLRLGPGEPVSEGSLQASSRIGKYYFWQCFRFWRVYLALGCREMWWTISNAGPYSDVVVSRHMRTVFRCVNADWGTRSPRRLYRISFKCENELMSSLILGWAGWNFSVGLVSRNVCPAFFPFPKRFIIVGRVTEGTRTLGYYISYQWGAWVYQEH